MDKYGILITMDKYGILITAGTVDEPENRAFMSRHFP